MTFLGVGMDFFWNCIIITIKRYGNTTYPDSSTGFHSSFIRENAEVKYD